MLKKKKVTLENAQNIPQVNWKELMVLLWCLTVFFKAFSQVEHFTAALPLQNSQIRSFLSSLLLMKLLFFCNYFLITLSCSCLWRFLCVSWARSFFLPAVVLQCLAFSAYFSVSVYVVKNETNALSQCNSFRALIQKFLCL